MNRIYIVVASLVALSIVFAPMAIYGETNVIATCGFRFITSPGMCNDRYEFARIDFQVLVTYWIGFLIVGRLIVEALKK